MRLLQIECPIKSQDPPRSEQAVSPQAVSESASVALRSAEVFAVPAVSADFLAASASPAAVPLLTSIALSPSAEVLNIRLAYPISSVIGAGQPEDKARQGPAKKTSRQPVGPLWLAPAHSTLRIQECPQRQILRAGASSVKKLLDIRIRGAPAG